MRKIVRSTWRILPTAWRTAFWLWFEKTVRPHIVSTHGFTPLKSNSRRFSRGDYDSGENRADRQLVVAGLFRSASGIGEAARGTYRSLRAAGLSPIAVDITEGLTPADYQTDILLERIESKEAGTLILHVNAPETLHALEAIGLISKDRRANKRRQWRVIGYWAWELTTLPKLWRRRFRCVSEIWTLSDFTAEAFRAAKGAPAVSAIPIAVEPPPQAFASSILPGPRPTGPNKPTVFLTMADANSSIARKNPVAAIKAFRTAFEDASEHRLIVKTRNLAGNEVAAQLLREAIGDAPNISLIDAPYTEEERWSLLATADVLISLHRAEGFGLPCAEAMSLGKTVIATGYSGNLFFMDETCAALVPYQLVPVEDPTRIYGGEGQQWAEPDIGAAADIMRRLAIDEKAREALGAAAKTRIAELCSPVAVGARMARLLKAV